VPKGHGNLQGRTMIVSYVPTLCISNIVDFLVVVSDEMHIVLIKFISIDMVL